jgi:hypothetical protein
VSLHQELLVALSLFLTITISNFTARVVLKRTGWSFLGLRDHRDGAVCLTILAVAVEAAWLRWSAGVVMSIFIGFLVAFWAAKRTPEREKDERQER